MEAIKRKTRKSTEGAHRLPRTEEDYFKRISIGRACELTSILVGSDIGLNEERTDALIELIAGLMSTKHIDFSIFDPGMAALHYAYALGHMNIAGDYIERINRGPQPRTKRR
jgi:hypothetical protein